MNIGATAAAARPVYACDDWVVEPQEAIDVAETDWGGRAHKVVAA